MNKQGEDAAYPRPAKGGVEPSAGRVGQQQMTWRCRVLGHAGEWSSARTNGVHWFSRCPRCHQQVVRDCSGSSWRVATGIPEANGRR